MKLNASLCLSIAALASIALTARANDTSISAIGGSAVALHHEHPYVQMDSETVRLDLYKDHYETTAEFVFENHGDARDVLMGFPERGVGMDGGSEDQLHGFTTSVDGVTVPATRIRATADRDTYRAYRTKSVAFAKGQTRHIRVHFRSPYGAGIEGTLAAYDFTGGNWRGVVKESRLIVTPHDGAPSLPLVRLDEKYLPAQNAAKPRQFIWRNWEAQGRLMLSQRKMEK